MGERFSVGGCRSAIDDVVSTRSGERRVEATDVVLALGCRSLLRREAVILKSAWDVHNLVGGIKGSGVVESYRSGFMVTRRSVNLTWSFRDTAYLRFH